MLAELRTKSQITIPKEIIKKLNLSEGDKLEVYEKDGTTFMDVYMHADCVGKGNLHTDFSRDM